MRNAFVLIQSNSIFFLILILTKLVFSLEFYYSKKPHNVTFVMKAIFRIELYCRIAEFPAFIMTIQETDKEPNSRMQSKLVSSHYYFSPSSFIVLCVCSSAHQPLRIPPSSPSACLSTPIFPSITALSDWTPSFVIHQKDNTESETVNNRRRTETTKKEENLVK